MSQYFDVGIGVYLASRITGDLMRIAGGFRNADFAVRRMEQSITMLTAQHELLGRRMLVTNQINQDSIQLMKDRETALLMAGDTEANLVQREQLAARIRAAEARSAIQQEETQLRLKRMSNDLTERQIALTEAQARAQREVAMTNIRTGAIGLGVGAALAVPPLLMAKAAGHLQMTNRQLESIYGFSPSLIRSTTAQSLQLQQHLGLFTMTSLQQLLGQLMGAGLSRRTALAIRPEVANIADVLALQQHTPIADTARVSAQIANLFGATTPAKFTPIAENLMRAALITPGGLNTLEGQLSYFAPLVKKGMTSQQMLQFAVMSQYIGAARGALSPQNLSTFLSRFAMAGNPFVGGRQMGYAEMLGIPQFRAAHPGYSLNQMVSFLERDRARMGDRQFEQVSSALFGVSRGYRTLLALTEPKLADRLRELTDRMNGIGSSAKMQGEILNTLEGQYKLFGTNLDALGIELGAPLVRPLQEVNGLLASMAAGLTNMAAHHQDTVGVLDQWAVTTGILIGGASGLKLLAGAFEMFTGGSLAAALLGLAGPMALLAAAITAATVAWEHRHQIEHWWDKSSWFNRILGIANPAVEGLVQHFEHEAHERHINRQARGAILDPIMPGVHIEHLHINLPSVGNAKQFARELHEHVRRAVTAVGAVSSVPESPLLHGKISP